MRYGAWNVRSLYRAGSLTTAARELAKYKLDTMGVHDVRWDIRGKATATVYFFWYGKRKEICQLRTRFFVHH
jgi:hypothetical protein